MPRTAAHQEIEIKLRVRDITTIRKRLRQIGAHVIVPRTYESNTLYDTPEEALRRRGRLLRLRIEERSGNVNGRPPRANSTAILTFKAPVRPAGTARQGTLKPRVQRQFKIREEAEVTLVGAKEMAGILRALGLDPTFHYEKFRTTYALPKAPGLKIELDETPIGNFLELEGPVEGIDRAARLLGYSRADYIRQTYGSLYLSECRRRGRKPGDMNFSSKKLL
jgi:adenylate cyclase, class 2